MNVKSNIIVAFIIVIIATIVVISLIKNKNNTNNEIIEISYTYGGGFGTLISTVDKTLTFTPNGNVKLSNSYNSYTEVVNIFQSKYHELNDFIVARLSLFDEEAKEDKSILDGSHSSIIIKLKNGQRKKIGGFMIKNKKYNEIENKISKMVNYIRIKQYERNIENNN